MDRARCSVTINYSVDDSFVRHVEPGANTVLQNYCECDKVLAFSQSRTIRCVEAKRKILRGQFIVALRGNIIFIGSKNHQFHPSIITLVRFIFHLPPEADSFLNWK